jgi:hypothetical protein
MSQAAYLKHRLFHVSNIVLLKHATWMSSEIKELSRSAPETLWSKDIQVVLLALYTDERHESIVNKGRIWRRAVDADAVL